MALSLEEILANMSHEIRTPVNAITGFARLLCTTDDLEKKRKYADLIQTNSTLLLKLVDDVLDIAKMKEGEVKFHEEEVDLNELMRSVECTVQLRVQQGTILNLVMGAAVCIVKTDAQRLSQVLLNMLTNACKFTQRGSITFGYEIHPGSIYFYVKDTGMGIPLDKKDNIFERFYREDHKSPGNGLGLAICKDIVERMGGKIGVESDGIGRGSRFWFTLPLSPKEEVQPEDDIHIESVPPALHKGKPTLLVAEDNESNYFLISSLLEDDYNLMHAWNGREAVEMYNENRPDLIIMDINMPLMDGYEATRNIRQVSGTVPVIAVTAYAFSSDRSRIMESGFNSYVSKPINADRLLSEISRLLG